jgi:hypothetical protein
MSWFAIMPPNPLIALVMSRPFVALFVVGFA